MYTYNFNEHFVGIYYPGSFKVSVQMKIKYLPHTADIRMLIEGETLQELFLAGLKGMNHILKEGVCKDVQTFDSIANIRTISNDRTNLLVDFLSDALTHSYVNKTLFCKMKVLHISSFEISAELYGQSIDEFDEEIKAVTYHEARIRKNSNNLWETIVIFDI